MAANKDFNDKLNNQQTTTKKKTKLKKQVIKDLDERPVHTPFVTSFNRKKTKDGIEITSAVLKRYYSVIDAEIYFQNEYVEDISDITWNIKQNMMPLFGYNSYVYDEVARGSRIIYGSFDINFISPNYLFDLLRRLDDNMIRYVKSYVLHKPSVKNQEVQQQYDIRLQGTRENDKHDPIWDKTFDIDIIFGQTTNVGEPCHVILEGVSLIDCTTVLSAYAANGSYIQGGPPLLQERYNFLARDITTLSYEGYRSSFDVGDSSYGKQYHGKYRDENGNVITGGNDI